MAALFMVGVAVAQAPQAIPFQAVARDSKGVVLANKTLALRFSVLDGPNNSATLDAIVYQETQTQTTNALGLFMVNIGQGNVVSGTFGSINWGTYNKFIQVDMDITGTGVSYTTIATQQLMSVPYALNSGNGVPVGTIIAYGANLDAGAPVGWELCNGTPQSTSDPKYANLFKAIGYSWGKNPGNGTFYLPFLNGIFLRGRANGWSNYDPDLASRTYIDGASYGDNVGSYQTDEIKKHDHYQFVAGSSSTYNTTAIQTTSPTNNFNFVADTRANYFINSDNTPGTRANVYPGSFSGGNESRPKNVSVQYIIKL